MSTPLRRLPNDPAAKPFGHTPHVHIETRSFIAGEPVVIDGHTFLVQAMDNETWGTISAPHAGSNQDAFGIVNRVSLKLEHAPWRGCPAIDDTDPSPAFVPRETFDALVEVAKYVSAGRSAIGHALDGAAYPDALARRALGALDDAGLLPTEGATA